ncbi:MAG TPA: DUF1080 domain-containing protein [Fimbriiglobus sp.]|nr:DUF1080 domain-containing protein [Fimbriiglobus sp.]
MAYRLLLSPVVVAVGLALAAGRADAADPPKGFTALFNGKDFTGWHGWAIHEKGGSPADLARLSPAERKAKIAKWTAAVKDHWKIEDGEIVNPHNSGPFLATNKEYGDIELLLEWKITPKVDSGLYLRATPQIQVWDATEPDPRGLGKAKGSGGMWNNKAGSPGRDPLVKADNPPGQWNKFRIIQVGDVTTIYLNGKLVVDHAKLQNFWKKGAPLPKTGAIILQTHPPEGEIRWRNIFVREIPPDEANEILRKSAGTGFRPVFDGKTLAGWEGAVQNYEVRDGAISCKPKKGGVLYTTDRYTDFAVQLEYKVPPGGNNGLAIRYPGKGQGSYDGMCELQILDDDAAKYVNKLDPRQFTGSAYGMAAATRGHGRPAGEWNFMLVTVQGPTIRVELNGATTLTTDLSQVTEYMGNRKHPGKDLKEGHFGFCGHNDPVAFRNIAIKPIPASPSR